MASDPDLTRLAAVQSKLGREATPADVAAFLGRVPVQAEQPVDVVEAPEDETLPAPRPRRGRPPRVKDEDES